MVELASSSPARTIRGADPDASSALISRVLVTTREETYFLVLTSRFHYRQPYPAYEKRHKKKGYESVHGYGFPL
jgi:hypothetical protein